jgi:hypothetical protein
VTKLIEDQLCPHCGVPTAAASEFCPACGRRQTCVKPPSRFAWLARVLAFIKSTGPLGRNPEGLAEAYKHGPMNHSDGGGGGGC